MGCCCEIGETCSFCRNAECLLDQIEQEGDGLTILERVAYLPRFDNALRRDDEEGQWLQRSDVLRAVADGQNHVRPPVYREGR